MQGLEIVVQLLMQQRKNMASNFRIVLSSLLTAIVVNFFFMHDGLAPGGITGLSLVLSTLSKIEVSTMTLVVSIPLLIVSTLVLGKGFGVKTLAIVILTPLWMRILPQVHLLGSLPNLVQWTVSSIVGGILIGLSIYLALKSDAATGGTDVLALLIQKKLTKVKLSKIILVLDGLIIVSTAMIHGNVLLAVFSFLSLYVITQTLNYQMKTPAV